MFCTLSLHYPFQQPMTLWVMAHPQPWWKQTKMTFLPVKARRQRKAMIPLTLSSAQSLKNRSTSSNASFLIIQSQLILACQPKKKQTFPRNIQTNLLRSVILTMRIKSILLLLLKRNLFLTVSPFPMAIFHTSCARSIKEINL